MRFLPVRLWEIRMLRGYTTENVAAQLGITKQAVSKYERGQAVPSLDIIKKIIELFNLPMGYLITPYTCSLDTVMFYRKNSRTSQKELDVAQIYMRWCYMIIDSCKKWVKLPAVDLPSFPLGLAIEEAAGRLRDYWKMGNNAVHDVEALLRRNGIFVFPIDLMNDKIDGYSQIISGNPIIILNSSKGNRQRQQFSLARELGHLLLHTREEYQNENDIEKEADDFAGCFLMPETAFSNNWIRNDLQSVQQVALEWKVSLQAVIERSYTLHLLGDTEEENRVRKTYMSGRLKKYLAESQLEGYKQCSLAGELRQIEQSDAACGSFMDTLCMPLQEIRRLTGMKNLFEQYGLKNRI